MKKYYLFLTIVLAGCSNKVDFTELIKQNDNRISNPIDISIISEETLSKKAKCEFANKQASEILLALLKNKAEHIENSANIEAAESYPLEDLINKFEAMTIKESKCDCSEGTYTLTKYKIKGSDSGTYFMTFNEKGEFDTKGEISNSTAL